MVPEYSEAEKTELLQYALNCGIMDYDTIQQKKELAEKKQYLEKHTFRIWQGSNGRFYTYLPDENARHGRVQIKRNQRSDLEDEIVRYYREQDQDPFIREIFEEWMAEKLAYGEIKKQTYDRYYTDFDRFFSGKKISEVHISHITENMLECFIKETIHDQSLTVKGWGNLRTLILGIFKYAKKKGRTRISITNFMGDLQLSRNAFRKRVFTDEESVFMDNEVAEIRNYINSQPPSIINLGILLSVETGVRVGELSALKPGDIRDHVINVSRTEERYKDENGHYVFRVREFTKGKNGYRNVFVTDQAMDILSRIREMNPGGEYLFMDNGDRIKGKAFTVKLEKICRYVGIQERSMHKIRKTYATRLLNGGVDEKLVTRQMGHTDILTTKNYYYFNNRNDDEAKEIISRAIG